MSCPHAPCTYVSHPHDFLNLVFIAECSTVVHANILWRTKDAWIHTLAADRRSCVFCYRTFWTPARWYTGEFPLLVKTVIRVQGCPKRCRRSKIPSWTHHLSRHIASSGVIVGRIRFPTTPYSHAPELIRIENLRFRKFLCRNTEHAKEKGVARSYDKSNSIRFFNLNNARLTALQLSRMSSSTGLWKWSKNDATNGHFKMETLVIAGISDKIRKATNPPPHRRWIFGTREKSNLSDLNLGEIISVHTVHKHPFERTTQMEAKKVSLHQSIYRWRKLQIICSSFFTLFSWAFRPDWAISILSTHFEEARSSWGSLSVSNSENHSESLVPVIPDTTAIFEQNVKCLTLCASGAVSAVPNT